MADRIGLGQSGSRHIPKLGPYRNPMPKKIRALLGFSVGPFLERELLGLKPAINGRGADI